MSSQHTPPSPFMYPTTITKRGGTWNFASPHCSPLQRRLHPLYRTHIKNTSIHSQQYGSRLASRGSDRPQSSVGLKGFSIPRVLYVHSGCDLLLVVLLSRYWFQFNCTNSYFAFTYTSPVERRVEEEYPYFSLSSKTTVRYLSLAGRLSPQSPVPPCTITQSIP